MASAGQAAVTVALVNPKSGGNMGSALLESFGEILPPGRVFNLVEDGGPERAIKQYRNVANLRIVGESETIASRDSDTTS